MKVFITGVTGFLGRSLGGDLRGKGHSVEGSSRRDAELGGRFEEAMFAGCDAVIHAAHDFGAGAMNKNIEGTLAFREAAARAGVQRQIFLTSYSARVEAESLYGRTKYAIEQHFEDSLRLGLVIGDGGLFARQRAMLLRMPIVPVLNFPVAVVGLAHVLDATEIVLREDRRGTWNLFYDQRPRMREFVTEVKAHAGQKARVVPVGVGLARAAGSLGLPFDRGQIRALELNESAPWKSDLPVLLKGRDREFCLGDALGRMRFGRSGWACAR